jgi:hypothetical protein
MAAHPEHHHFLLQANSIAQFGAKSAPVPAVHLDIAGITEENALPRPGRHRPGGDLFAMLFPHRAREEQQATMRVSGERHTAFTLLHQGVAMLGRY